MYSVRDAVEAFVRLAKAELPGDAVLAPPDEACEIQRVPGILLQGPRFEENRARRTMAKQVEKDAESLEFEEREYPRFYHLDFDVIATAATAADLIDLAAGAASFFARRREIEVPPDGDRLALSELAPVGGLARVNLSDLKQASGRCRVEDCAVYGGGAVQGRLVVDRVFDYSGPEMGESRTHGPQEE